MSIQIQFSRKEENIQYARLKAMPSLCHLRVAADEIYALAKPLCEEKNWSLPSARIIGQVAGVFYSARVVQNGMKSLELPAKKIAELAHVGLSSCKLVLKIFQALKIINSFQRFGRAIVNKCERAIKRTSIRELTNKGLELFGLIDVMKKRAEKKEEYEKKKKSFKPAWKNYKPQTQEKQAPKPSGKTYEYYKAEPIPEKTPEEKLHLAKVARASIEYFVKKKITKEEYEKICTPSA